MDIVKLLVVKSLGLKSLEGLGGLNFGITLQFMYSLSPFHLLNDETLMCLYYEDSSV